MLQRFNALMFLPDYFFSSIDVPINDIREAVAGDGNRLRIKAFDFIILQIRVALAVEENSRQIARGNFL